MKRPTPKLPADSKRKKPMTMKEYEKSPEDKRADKRELDRINAKRRHERT